MRLAWRRKDSIHCWRMRLVGCKTCTDPTPLIPGSDILEFVYVCIYLRTRPDVARWVGKSQPVGSTPFVQCRISLEESTPAVNNWRSYNAVSGLWEITTRGCSLMLTKRHSVVVEMNTFEGEFPSTTKGHSLNSRCL